MWPFHPFNNLVLNGSICHSTKLQIGRLMPSTKVTPWYTWCACSYVLSHVSAVLYSVLAALSWAWRHPPCPIRSDRQTTSLTLTTGAPYRCTNGKGCEQHEYSLWRHRFLLTVVWRSHLGQIVWAAWIGQGGGGFLTHSTYTWYPGVCR